MFQVFVNSMNGIHSVNVDPQYKVGLQFLWHCLVSRMLSVRD